MKFHLSIAFLTAILIMGCNAKTENVTENPDSAHTSENSLDWAGSYTGILPCASCPGIRTEIKLSHDHTYQFTTIYIDDENNKIFRDEGNFEWSKNGLDITLNPNSSAEEQTIFKVGENVLFLLDKDGNRVEGDLKDLYKLNKVLENEEITGKYWKLVEIDGVKVEDAEYLTKEAHFVLNEENKIAGNLGCNLFNGSYKLGEGSTINFSKMAVTLMACDDMEVESAFIRILEHTNHYSMGGDVLLLNNKEGQKTNNLAKFVAVYL